MIDYVQDLLRKHGVLFRAQGQDYLIKCPNPQHEDNNPSCRVDKLTGKTHCFACGFKTNIFTHFGVLTNPTGLKVNALLDKLRELYISTSGLEMPPGAKLVRVGFRGISVKTLQHFEAFTTDRVPELEDRLVFPIKDLRDRIQVFVARHTLSNSGSKYINYPKSVAMPVYPANAEPIGNSIVLVEGIFDMLNLYDKGLTNVVCCFGVSTILSNASSKLLPYKAKGTHTIYIAFDGDKAGKEGAAKLQPILEKLGYRVEIIALPEDTDPGNLELEDVQSIKEYILEKSSNY